MRCSPLLLLALSACLPEFPGKTYREDPAHDFDGDGVTEADGDCDDSDAAARPGAVWYRDGDGDLYGDPTVSTVSCSVPAGFVADGTDCDDSVSGVHPGVEETCTPFDDDCDGSLVVPEGAAVPTWHLDADADGFGATDGETRTQCDPPAGFVYDATDCDDARADVRPRAPERCDGRDNDCDGATDDADPDASDRYTWYADTDSDGFGASDATTLACDAPAGFVEAAGDCDDTRGDVAPGAAETCDGVDQDCDGYVDDGVQGTYYADLDADGFGDPAGTFVEACSAPAGMTEDFTDCDDLDPDSFPGADEVCDGGDNDCDGRTDEAGAIGATTWYADADADGYGDRDFPFAACTQPASYVAVAGDCNDGRADVSPGASESCRTGFDDDCDGDDNDPGAIGCNTFWPDADADGFGDSASPGSCTCTASTAYPARDAEDCDDARAAVNPDQLEDCGTGFDDDCDADTNDAGAAGCTYFYVDVDGDGYGDDTLSDAASCTCEGAGYLTATVEGDCDDTDTRVSPSQAEVCGGGDEDCSGAVDDDAIDASTWYRDSDGDGFGDSASSRLSCTTPSGYARADADCDDGRSGVYPGRTEDCLTTFDDDCDGTADEENASGCTNYFYDYDGDGYGTSTSRCLCSSSGYYTAATLGDCDDADAGTSPAALNCGLLGTVSTSSAAAVVTGRVVPDSGYDRKAFSAVSALDYNRDGFVDIVTGSAGEDSAYTDSGAVYLWLGGSSGLTGAHPATSLGDASLRFAVEGLQHACGEYVSSGDVDGDGYDEILVGCAGGSNGYLIDDGLDGIGTVTPSTGGVDTLRGYPVGLLVGDVNNDGLVDGLVAASAAAGTATTFYPAYGDVTGVNIVLTESVLINANPTTGSRPPSVGFSHSVSGSDIDGDGFDDIVANSGPLRIYSGGAHLSSTPSFSCSLSTIGSTWMTYTVQAIGDFNGDGRNDVAVGSPDTVVHPYRGALSYGGSVRIYAGGSDAGGAPTLVTPSNTTVVSAALDYSWKFDGNNAYDMTGYDVASVGDIDGDEAYDIGISSSEGGVTYIMYGNAAFSGETILSSAADAALSGVRYDVTPAGDVNADGYDDLWAGGESLYLFHGTPR